MEEHECTVPGEIKAIKNIAKGNFSAAAAALCSMESMKSHIFVENTKLTMLEVVNYSKQADNMLKVSSPNSVSTFSNSQYYQQLCRMCPRLVCLLAAICKSGKPATLKNNPLSELGKCDVEPKLRNAICAAASVCLHQYNPILSVYHYRNGLMLLHGGVKAASLDRCYKLGLTVSQKSCIRMQEKFGGNFDEKVLKWTEETKEKELMIRFLEEAKQRVQLLEKESLTECSINFSCVEELKEFHHYDEATYQNCLNLLKDIREKECSVSAGPISSEGLGSAVNVSVNMLQKAVDNLRGSISHFK